MCTQQAFRYNASQCGASRLCKGMEVLGLRKLVETAFKKKNMLRCWHAFASHLEKGKPRTVAQHQDLKGPQEIGRLSLLHLAC